METMINCRVCGAPAAKRALKCMKCGAESPGVSNSQMARGRIVGVILIFLLLGILFVSLL